MGHTKRTLQPAEEEEILQAVRDAERLTSGEIRVHIESRCKTADPVGRAVEVFYQLQMEQTLLSNGVLVYVALVDHKLAIVGDKGINEVVPPGFWNAATETMISHFRDDRIGTGISAAVRMAGEQLQAFFPRQQDDINELPDGISHGE